MERRLTPNPTTTMEIHIRPAHPTEAAQLTRIAVAAKRHWGYSAALLQLWHNDLTITAAQIVRQPTSVAVVREVPVAVGMLGAHPDGIELAHLWVRPDLIGRGVGRQLFTHLCQIARTAGFSQLSIEADPHAVGFYERMGAVQIGSVTTPHGRSLPLLRYELPPAAAAGV